MVFRNFGGQKNRIENSRDSIGQRSGIIAFFAEHKVAANLLMALVILFGIYGLSQLKRQLMPDFGLELITIQVEWPGASAEDIETNVINAIEPEVRFINGVKEVNAIAFESRGKVQIFFNQTVSMSKALTDVQSAVSRISTFPTEIEKPIITQTIQRDEVSRIDISGPFSEKTLKFFARQMRDDLINLGLANVEFEGARDQEIWIEIPSDNLRELDLSLQEISSSLASASIDIPSGSINSVLISNLLPHGVGDLIAIHVLGNSAHLGNIGAGSSTVLANNIPLARLMDKGTCGAVLMGSVGNVLVGG